MSFLRNEKPHNRLFSLMTTKFPSGIYIDMLGKNFREHRRVTYGNKIVTGMKFLAIFIEID